MPKSRGIVDPGTRPSGVVTLSWIQRSGYSLLDRPKRGRRVKIATRRTKDLLPSLFLHYAYVESIFVNHSVVIVSVTANPKSVQFRDCEGVSLSNGVYRSTFAYHIHSRPQTKTDPWDYMHNARRARIGMQVPAHCGDWHGTVRHVTDDTKACYSSR